MRRHSDSIKLSATPALLSPEIFTFEERVSMKDIPDPGECLLNTEFEEILLSQH